MSLGVGSIEQRDLATSRALTDWIEDMQRDPPEAARLFLELVDRVETRCARLGVPYRSRDAAEAAARDALETAILGGAPVVAVGADIYAFDARRACAACAACGKPRRLAADNDPRCSSCVEAGQRPELGWRR